MTAPCPTRVYFPVKRRVALTAPPADAPSMAVYISSLIAAPAIAVDDASTATRPSGAGNS